MRWIILTALLLASCSTENMQTSNPIVHDPPGGMPNKTYEYVLPITSSDIRAEHLPLFTPWFQRYLDQSPSDIRQVLSADWKNFSPADTVKFRGYLLSLTPKSIVVDGDRIWLTLHSASSANSFMIHEPRMLTQAEVKFVRSFDVDSLEIFCTHFFDAYEDVTPYTNAISMRPEPVTNDSFSKSGDWLNGIYLYYICNGDAILLAPDGRIGRWSHEIGWDDAPGYNRPCALEECASSFGEFLDQYLTYLKMDWNDRKATVFW